MNTHKEYLTIVTISQRTGIPQSSVRGYIKTFESFFPCKGSGKRKRYEKRCIEVVTFIRKQYALNQDRESIATELSKRFPVYGKVLQPYETTRNSAGNPVGNHDMEQRIIDLMLKLNQLCFAQERLFNALEHQLIRQSKPSKKRCWHLITK